VANLLRKEVKRRANATSRKKPSKPSPAKSTPQPPVPNEPVKPQESSLFANLPKWLRKLLPSGK